VSAFQEESDERLMVLYQQGDVRAFEQILDRHRKPLYGYLVRMLKDTEHAEDAFQEVFLRIIKSRMSYEPSARFTQWMYRIAHNYCIDCFRRKGLENMESLDQARGEDSDQRLSDYVAASDPSPEELAAASEQERALEAAIGSLSPEQREVFLLRERGGLSFREIARMLDIPINTAKSRMRYALQGLRKYLEDEGGPLSEVS
jgi:RNA polymerase sigma-70 factor (ECF subfamily)